MVGTACISFEAHVGHPLVKHSQMAEAVDGMNLLLVDRSMLRYFNLEEDCNCYEKNRVGSIPLASR